MTVALLLTAMTCQGPQGFIARNISGQTLSVEIVAGDPSDVGTVRTGSALTLSVPGEGCDGTSVVARTQSGEVVAQLEQPACDGDVWVIEEERAYLRE